MFRYLYRTFAAVAIVSWCLIAGSIAHATGVPGAAIIDPLSIPGMINGGSSNAANSLGNAINGATGNNSLLSPGFSLSPTYFQFGSQAYNQGSGNMSTLLIRLTTDAMIIVMVIAALGIVIGGVFISSSAGESKRAEEGKNILKFNIIAISLSLISYSIIELVSWILIR